MSEELLIKHCSPTLAGLKTGNLFICGFESKTQMNCCLRCWNKKLSSKGVRIIPMRYRNGRALIYAFRPKFLERNLTDSFAAEILKKQGYTDFDPQNCVVRLVDRVCSAEEFPHEIGLFLGYPPEDVFGFIENKAGGYKTVGCWKVYGDVNAAEKTFAKYKKCTDVYSVCFAGGRSIERLTVTV